MFRESFKYYKRRKPPPDLTDVIDLDKPNLSNVRKVQARDAGAVGGVDFGLTPPSDWRIYELLDIPGLVLIRNPFMSCGQRYWITKCLKDYSKRPNKLNIDAHNILGEDESWWEACFGNCNKAEELVPKLRWATLGYHHNWDTKHYSEDWKTEMPVELSDLTRFIAKTLGHDEFRAEAAIINYYRMNSTLAGHTDRSEVNKEAPLFSISFGQTAIFLIGGLTQEDPAHAMFLRSGDVLAMSGESRLRYHGVPRIIPTHNSIWDDPTEDESCPVASEDWAKARNYIDEARININARQVLMPGQNNLY